MKRFIIVLIIMLGVLDITFAQNLLVNNKQIEEGSTLNLFSEDLDQGKIFFSLRAEKFSKIEITFDQGRTWQQMQKEDDYFVFGYRPLQEEEIKPEFLLTEETGSIRTYRPNIKVVYQKKRPDDAVLQVLDKMKLYYEQENIDRFINLFSSSYPDIIKFKEAIQNDFYNYKNIRLRYRVDRRTFDSDFKGAIWDVYWERKYEDRQGTEFSDSANIAMRFDKEGPNWLISGMRGNTIFGSTLLVNVDLTLSDSDITGDYVGSDYVISAVIYNNGTTTANNFKVRFYSSPGDGNFDGTVEVSSLGPNSQTTVSYTAPPGVIPSTVTVTVDSTNVIPETNENNNSVTKKLIL